MIFIILFLFAIPCQSLWWTVRIEGDSGDYASAVAFDRDGNLFTAGTFSSVELSIFDGEGMEAHKLPQLSLDTSSFLAKFTDDGEYLWSTIIYSENTAEVSQIVSDGEGNVVLVGSYGAEDLYFYDSNDYETYSGSIPGDQTYGAIFVAKYNAAGRFVWAARIDGDSNEDIASDVTVDSENNIYIAGALYSNQLFIFDSRGVQVDSLISQGFESGYLVKIDQLGLLLWAIAYVGAPLTSISLDNNDNIALAGSFAGTKLEVKDSSKRLVKTIPNPVGSVCMFSLVYTKAGTLAWDSQIVFNDYTEASVLIKFDPEGNLYQAGNTLITDVRNERTLNFKSRNQTVAHTLTQNNLNNVFISKYSAGGNFLWAGQIYVAPSDFLSAKSIDYDVNKRQVLISFQENSFEFNVIDSTKSTSKFITADKEVSMIVALDSDGIFRSTMRLSGSTVDISQIRFDRNGNLAICGFFYISSPSLYNCKNSLCDETIITFDDGTSSDYAAFVALVPSSSLPAPITTSSKISSSSSRTAASSTKAANFFSQIKPRTASGSTDSQVVNAAQTIDMNTVILIIGILSVCCFSAAIFFAIYVLRRNAGGTGPFGSGKRANISVTGRQYDFKDYQASMIVTDPTNITGPPTLVNGLKYLKSSDSYGSEYEMSSRTQLAGSSQPDNSATRQ